MSDENGEKTELPTDRRRHEVREQGNVARSMDLNAAALLLAAAAGMQFFGGPLSNSLARYMDESLRERAWLTIDTALVMTQFWKIGEVVIGCLLPLLALMAISALAVNLLQVGFLITTETLQPKLSRLNPLEGLKRIFSMQGIVRLAASLGKLLLLSGVCAWFIYANLGQFLGLSNAQLESSSATLGFALVNLAFQLALALTVLALADYGFQYWKFEQDLKMTKQEIREEMRQMEGDPQIRHRRREVHRKLATSQQMQQVKDADVVVTNPTHIAVAIKYDAKTMAAPIVVAKGMGELAARIRLLAAEHSVPIVEKKPLARALYKTVKVGHPVPVELYEVIAEIMAYVYRIKGKAKKAA